MLKQLKIFITIVLLPLLLSSCLFGQDGYIHDRKQVYLKSQSEPGLKLPAGATPAKAQPSLSIPNGKSWSNGSAPSMLPPGEPQLKGKKAKIHHTAASTSSSLGQYSKGFSSLKVTASYPQTWVNVNKAITKMGYQVIGSDKTTGIIEVMSPAEKNQISEIYQLSLVEADKSTLISLLDQQGNPVSSSQARTMLHKLRSQLKV